MTQCHALLRGMFLESFYLRWLFAYFSGYIKTKLSLTPMRQASLRPVAEPIRAHYLICFMVTK